MSNLNLPTMTYANLSHVLGGRPSKAVAYATTIERVGQAIYVKHHASVIAVLEPDLVYVTNAGYESSTTTNRIQQILRANGIPWSVRIRNFSNVIARNFEGTFEPFTRATFDRLPGHEWEMQA